MWEAGRGVSTHNAEMNISTNIHQTIYMWCWSDTYRVVTMVVVGEYGLKVQEAQLSPRDRATQCQLKSCQLSRNSAETTCTSHEQIEVMKLEGYSGAMCNKHVHSTMTRSSRFHCPIGVINKPTTNELCISTVY